MSGRKQDVFIWTFAAKLRFASQVSAKRKLAADSF